MHFRAFHYPTSFVNRRSVGAWRSLVAHLFWVQGVVGSNPADEIVFIAQLGERQTEDLKVPSSILGSGILSVWPSG